jgi:hypothetical protein
MDPVFQALPWVTIAYVRKPGRVIGLKIEYKRRTEFYFYSRRGRFPGSTVGDRRLGRSTWTQAQKLAREQDGRSIFGLLKKTAPVLGRLFSRPRRSVTGARSWLLKWGREERVRCRRSAFLRRDAKWPIAEREVRRFCPTGRNRRFL